MRMRIHAAIFAASLISSAVAHEGHVETIVFPLEFEALAKAHHCVPVLHSLPADEPGHDMPFEIRGVPPTRMFAGWCTREPATQKLPTDYILMVWIQSPDNPLHHCPDEIHGITRIGHPDMDVVPMIPHDFVILGTHDRPPVRDKRIMFVIRIQTPGVQAFYACIVDRWALYTPEQT